jgi:hypothetical protein
VAHSNCQQKLEEIWYTGVRKISKMNPILILLLTVLHVVCLPITSLFYIMLPHSKIGKFMSQPCIKFITHTSSYIFFIGMIVASYFVSEQSSGDFMRLAEYKPYRELFVNYTRSNLTIKVDFCNFFIRVNKPQALDIILSVWVIGETWHELKKFYVYGLSDYLYSSSNVFNFTMDVFFIAGYGLKYYTMYIVNCYLSDMTSNATVHEGRTFWSVVATLDPSNNSLASNNSQIYVYEAFYWLNSGRPLH